MGSEDKPENLAEGTLMSHLLELRNRLLKAVLAMFVLFIPCAIFANELFNSDRAAAGRKTARGQHAASPPAWSARS